MDSEYFKYLPQQVRKHKLVQFLIYLKLLDPVQIIEYNGGTKAFVDLSDPNPRNYFLTKSFEPNFFNTVLGFCKNEGDIFDIGSNFGLCSFGLADLLKKEGFLKKNFHSFEANQALLQYQQKTSHLYADYNFYLNWGCVSDCEGLSSLNICQKELGQSYITNNNSVKKIPNIILDQYIQKNKIQNISFMKMDIEGFEVFALKGMLDSLKKGIIKTLWMEVSEPNLSRYNVAPGHIFNILLEHEYKLYWDPEDCNQTKTLYRQNRYRALIPKQFPKNLQTDILAIHSKYNFNAD
jgi:FkbM family methyltransferase